ncbi:hypothetical protein ACFWWM_25840 [Streptomyces sp. NPDC058682]|uniref:hypothetical protein n=1 Tax=Streptomyces sp. NPDC058682 TaxID=3346596 RepID=UPI00366917EC
MDLRPPVPARRLEPHALTKNGIAALLARYEFGDSCVRRVMLDQEFGPQARGRLARIVVDARVVDQGLRWEPVCLDLFGVERFRIDESRGFAWALYDPPQFTHFDGLLQVDLCAERNLHPRNTQEAFEGSELVFAATDGSWSALQPWGSRRCPASGRHRDPLTDPRDGGEDAKRAAAPARE